MRKSLAILVALCTVSFGQLAAQVKGSAPFKTSGHSLQEAPAFRNSGGLEQIPTKAQLSGMAPGIQAQCETTMPSLIVPDYTIAPRANRAEGERTARALLIYTDTDKNSNRIIELPISVGAVSSFSTVADRVPPMPYKAYGEMVVNAVAFDNMFMASTWCSMLYSQTNSVYTTADWVHQYNYDYRVADLEMTAVYYNKADGITYGVFQGINPANGADEWFFGRWVDPSSYTQPQPIKYIGTRAWYGMAISPEGVIYAIDNSCNLLKVDKATGEQTLIGSTGLTNTYKTSACYDGVNNRILFATSLDAGSAMYSIDPSTARATMLYQMPHGEQIVGLFIPDPEAADKAPAAALGLTCEFPLGSMTGDILFEVPSTYFDGTPASGSVNYTVGIDGETVAEGTAAYGESVSAEVTVAQSNSNVVTVRLSNEAGSSPITRATLFCGTPIPRSPYFTTAIEYDSDSRCFYLAWSPNYQTTGTTGGTVNNDELSYELIRYPDMKTITTEMGVTSLLDPYVPADDNLTLVYYEIKSIYHGQKSLAVRSLPVKFGKITPPYLDEMWNNISGAAYSTLPTATDNLEWSYIGPVTPQEKQHGWMYHGKANSATMMDSYLLTSPINLRKGKIYTLNFTAAATNTSWRNERMAVYMGRELTPEGIREQTLLEPTLVYSIREENGERMSVNFTAPEDGVYYIAFHHNSDPNLRFLYIGDIEITAPVGLQVPGEVENLKIEPAEDGVLHATISFILPSKAVNGETLTALPKVKIFRNDEQIADFTPASANVTYVDLNAVNGVNQYTITPYNEYGDGLSVTSNIFIGVSSPVNPSPWAWFGENDGQALVTWPSVTQDQFGTTLANSTVTYEIQREYLLSGSTVRESIGSNVSGNSFADQFCAPGAEQNSARYWVRAVTPGGNSQWVSTRMLGLGKPYDAPWFESFPNAKAGFNWHTIGNSMSWTMVTDDIYDDAKSVDGDNGFMLAQTSTPGATGLIYSGAIYVPADMTNPHFSFYYLNQGSYQGVPVKNYVEMAIIDGDGQHHVAHAVCDGEWGWERLSYDLSAYKGKKVQVGVYMECVDRPFIALDAFRVASRYNNDLGMVSIAGPEEVEVGEDATFTVSYENLGFEDAPAGYKVQLYRDGVLVEEKSGEDLDADSRASVNFTLTTNPTMGEAPEFTAKVVYGEDEAADNNESVPFTLKIVNNIGYPEPLNLLAEQTAEGIKLQWEAPDMSTTPRQNFTESFENFDSFAKEIDGWTLHDIDGGIVMPISNTIKTEETHGAPFGFFVMDNSVSPFDQYDEFYTPGGSKYMASQYVADANGNPLQNDDWLISPELSGDLQTASFMGKSISSSWPESFEVYYSTTGTAVDDFILLGGVANAPADWIHYTVTLPKGSKYFAIRCVSYGCLQFMVDDVTLRLKSCDPIELTHKGYNVYRDGTPLNATPLSELSFVDPVFDGKEHTYHVTALYAQGESTPSIASVATADVESIAADGFTAEAGKGYIRIAAPADCQVMIVNAAGVCLYNACGSLTVILPAGVYVVSTADATLKLLVR